MKRFSLLLALAATTVLAAERLPNIVFILADDLGYGDLASYGHPYAKTPALDQLAREGTSFKQFYVTGVTCCPSRTGFMTSRHPASYGKYMSYHGFDGRMTITELLHEKGYRTGHFGKWHIGPESSDGTYGIDHIEVIDGDPNDPNGRDTNLFEAAIDFIEENQETPFYVNVWGHISHFPVGPAPSLVADFSDLTVTRSDFDERMQAKFDRCQELGGDVDAGMRNYLADVNSLDIQVGRLLQKLDDLKLRDNTIVVFSSDQGAAPINLRSGQNNEADRIPFAVNMLGYGGGLRGGKHTQFEGGVRSPFIIRWPGRVPADRVDADSIFSGLDWLPTLCSITDIPIDPSQFEGEDASDIWFGATRSRVQPLFWKTSSASARPSMQAGKWKLHVGQQNKIDLYDLSVDPGEYHNIAAQRPEVVDRLKRQLDAWNATLPKDYLKQAKTRNKRK